MLRIFSKITLVYFYISVALFAQASAQEYNTSSNLLLVGQFGELCTMCEAIVLCDDREIKQEYTQIPDDGSFTVYHFHTRTFWSQVFTIWDVFISNFNTSSVEKRGHTRPIDRYDIQNGEWKIPQRIDARLTLDPGVIDLAQTKIDRITREWLDKNNQAIGTCQRLPLWMSLETISKNTSGSH